MDKSFDTRLTALSDKFAAVLDDFRKYFVFYNKNPEIDEYERIFSNNRAQLAELSSGLFAVTTDIQSAMMDLKRGGAQLNRNIVDERRADRRMGALSGHIGDVESGSEQMLADMNSQFRRQWWYNWTMLASIVVIIVAFSVIFKKQRAAIVSAVPAIFQIPISPGGRPYTRRNIG